MTVSCQLGFTVSKMLAHTCESVSAFALVTSPQPEIPPTSDLLKVKHAKNRMNYEEHARGKMAKAKGASS